MKTLIALTSLATAAVGGAALADTQRLSATDYLQAVTCEVYKARTEAPDAAAWTAFLKEQSRRRDPMVSTMAEAREDEGRQIARMVRRGGEMAQARARQIDAQCAAMFQADTTVQASPGRGDAASL